MNAVGIDVSKGKSMVAALRPMGEVASLPQEFLRTEVGLEQMAYAIIALGEDTRVIMETTGRCRKPVAAALHEYGAYVCALNLLYIMCVSCVALAQIVAVSLRQINPLSLLCGKWPKYMTLHYAQL